MGKKPLLVYSKPLETILEALLLSNNKFKESLGGETVIEQKNTHPF